jgi:stalled ribosome rescue protein Dom34
MGKRKKKKGKRGFPVCILVGFEEQAIHLYTLFSESAKKYRSMNLPRKWKNASEKDRYHFYEELLDLVRPLMEQGLKSILLISPPGTEWANYFLVHIEKHYRWLRDPRGKPPAVFGQMDGHAYELKGVRYFMEQEEFQNVVARITSEEAYYLIKELEKSINSNNPNISVVYGLREAEDFIYKGGKKDDSAAEKSDYLLLTDEFLETHKQKNRIYRLKQIAENKGIITKVVCEETPAGERIKQFGGVICFKTTGYY